jgi:hypothetical protein
LPPLPVVVSTMRCVLHTQLSGGPVCLTRFHMKYTGAVSATDATTMCTTVGTSWNTRLAPLCGSQATLIDVQIEDLGSKTGVNVVVPVSHAGTSGSGAVPASVAFVMSAHVAFRYRGGHSRVYLAGLNTTLLTDVNTWSVTAQGSVNTAWTGILADLVASPPVAVGSLSAVVVHAYSSNPADFGGTPPTTKPPWPLATPVTYPVTSWSTNPQAGSQRRRNQQP